MRVLVLWLAVSAIGIVGQSGVAQQAALNAPAREPRAEVHLEAHEGRTQFKLGDLITLDLVFTSGSPGYAVNTNPNTYLPAPDLVNVTPADGWFQSHITLFGQGQNGNELIDLGSEPVRVPVLLNRTIVFQKPGHYEVTLTTERLRPSKWFTEWTASDVRDLRRTTGEVAIDIGARDEHEESSLVRLSINELAGESAEARQDTARRLAYLGGDDAIRAKVSIIAADKDTGDAEPIGPLIVDGLPNSRNVQLQLDLLETAWRDPHRVPTSVLQIALRQARELLHKQMVTDEGFWAATTEERQAVLQDYQGELSEIVATLPQRTVSNRAETASFLMTRGVEVSGVSCPAQAHLTDRKAPAIFTFHSGVWVNLHHFLYLHALAATPQTQKGPHPSTLSKADAEELNRLSPKERASWDTAVSYYASSMIQRDLLFDRGMAAIKNQLEDSETSDDLADADIPSALKTVLLKAAPIYRKHWWPTHDAQNRQWIAQLQPLIDTHGEKIRSSLVKIYETPWPQQPVRVDAVVYANWAGAYTTLAPTRPTISTTDPTNQGPAALEIVFHESSHAMMDKLIDAINTAEEAAKARAANGAIQFRRDLWHEVLFYTAGELGAEQIPGYIPYADKNGLWTRAWPGPDHALIEQDWKSHMDGTVGLEPALKKLIEDLASAQRHL